MSGLCFVVSADSACWVDVLSLRECNCWVLFSTDLTAVCAGAQVEDLARLSFKRQPLYVGVDDAQDAATREGLEQGYCMVPSAQRFLLLFTFLKKNASKKVGSSLVMLLPVKGRLSRAHSQEYNVDCRMASHGGKGVDLF